MSGRGRLGLAGLVGLAIVLLAAAPILAGARPFARVIEHLDILSGDDRFGAVRFLGGYDLSGLDDRLSGLSGLVLSDGGTLATFVDDSGFLVTARLRREEGRIVGVDGIGSVPIDPGADGIKDLLDAEDLAMLPSNDGRDVAIAFERQGAPVRVFRRDGDRLALRATPALGARERLRNNGGLEAIAIAPESAGLPAGGRIVAIAERSFRGGDEGSAPGFILGLGAFTVRRSDGFAVTAARFLPEGDLLLLERRFSPARGLGMRLRRVAGREIVPGAVVDGAVVARVDGLRYQIDNMEGMDVWTDEEGRSRLTIVSDDNRSLFQRTLMLEFELVVDTDGGRRSR